MKPKVNELQTRINKIVYTKILCFCNKFEPCTQTQVNIIQIVTFTLFLTAKPNTNAYQQNKT